MKSYEALIILPTQLVGDTTQSGKNIFEDLIKKHDGKIVSTTELGKRLLGYTVKRQKEGNVISSALGNAEFDEDVREVRVESNSRDVQRVEVGAFVYGRVALVKDAVVVITMARAEKNGKSRKIFDSSATINIARVSQEYVRSLDEYFKVGDYVKARVTDVNSYGVDLATNEPGLGVIFSRDEVIQSLVAGPEQFAVKKTVSHGHY